MTSIQSKCAVGLGLSVKMLASIVVSFSFFTSALAETENDYRFTIKAQLPLSTFVLPEPGDNNSPWGFFHTPISLGVRVSERTLMEFGTPIPIFHGYHGYGTVNYTFAKLTKFDFFSRVGGGYFKEFHIESGPIWKGPTIISGIGVRWRIGRCFSLVNQFALITLLGELSNTSLPQNQREDVKFLPSFDLLGLEFRF